MALNQVNLAPFQFSPVQNALNTALTIPEMVQKMKLMAAQTAESQAKAQNPFAAQGLSGPAHDAYSDWLFQQKFAKDPKTLALLNQYKDAKDASANARWFTTIPSDFRTQIFAKAAAIGMPPDEYIGYSRQGLNANQIIQIKKAQTAALTQQNQNITPQTSQNQLSSLLNMQLPGTNIPSAQVPGQPGVQVPMAAQLGISAPTMPSSTQSFIQPSQQSIQQRPQTPYEQIQPVYPAQPKTLENQQHIAMGEAALDSIGGYIAKNGSSYGGPSQTLSKKWFWDINYGTPQQKITAAKYYVANLLSLENALVRTGMMGANPSAKAMTAISDTIMGKHKVDLQYAPPDMKSYIQNEMNDALLNGSEAMTEQAASSNPGIYKRKTDYAKAATVNISSHQKDLSKLSIEDLKRIRSGK